ncbi:SMI1/KNR4 family protein [Actinomadura scrupuli]|uniref:SMI1/KNR4 family protein n=1 Tax=Actinomadura scrupuli TaxID=559629 RepID=UPI003D95B85C
MDQWRESVETSIALLCEGFTERMGYPPGENQLSGPASLHQLARLEATLGARVPDQLRRFYERIGDAELADFWNGLWIMPPEWVAGFHGTDGVRRITGALDTEVLVFATDGGGNMFGLKAPEGRPVYSMPTAEVRDGAYETDRLHSPDDSHGFRVIAEDFHGFLRLVSTQLDLWVREDRPPTFF